MKISVLMITYNHERFIAQAIESVLMQETNFEYELVIGEDCSTDNTRAIVLDFERRYPERVRVLPSQPNLGVSANFSRTLQACRGEFIALLEGDDFWTVASKLQLQADYLDSHKACATCFHDTTVLENETLRDLTTCHNLVKGLVPVADLLTGVWFATCSVMFRNGLLPGLPEPLVNATILDLPLLLLLGEQGNIAYLDQCLACYRIHPGGVWSGQSSEKKLLARLDMYQRINTIFGGKYQTLTTDLIARCHRRLAGVYAQRGEAALARQHCSQWFRHRSFREHASDRSLPKDLVRIYTPRLFRRLRAAYRVVVSADGA